MSTTITGTMPPTPLPAPTTLVLSNVAKGILQVLAATLSVVIVTLHTGVTPFTLTSVVIQILTAIGVYVVPEIGTGFQARAKTWLALAGAVLQAIVVVISPAWGWQVSYQDWLLVAVAGLAVVGTHILPNSSAAIGTIANVFSSELTADAGPKHSAATAVAPVTTVTTTEATSSTAGSTVITIPHVTANP